MTLGIIISAGFFCVMFLSAGLLVPINDQINLFGHYIFIGLGGLAGLIMSISVFAYTAPLISDFFYTMRRAWAYPQTHYAELVASMTPKQIEILENRGIFRVKGKYQQNNLHWFLVTGILDLPFDWIDAHLIRCEEMFPDLPTQHGLPDNIERGRRQAFNRWITNDEWGIATWGRGGNPCYWTLPNMASVYQLFGWS